MLNLSLETEYVIKKHMKILLYMFLLLNISCKNSEVEIKAKAQTNSISIVQENNSPQIKDSIIQEAEKLVSLFENNNCKEFYNVFPNTFQKLNQLYGYEDGKGGHILFSKYPEHFEFFFNCSEVTFNEKLKKAIEIGIDGKWEADTIGTFQDSTYELVKEHPNELSQLLNKLSDDKASSFWFFLLDGAHPTDKEKVKRVELLNNLLGENSKQSRLMLEQFKKLRSLDKH